MVLSSRVTELRCCLPDSRLNPLLMRTAARNDRTKPELGSRRGTIHDLRHTALTNLAAAGASQTALMETAGHRSFQTTQQYIDLAGVVFRDEAEALSRRLLGVPETGTNPAQTVQASQSS